MRDRKRLRLRNYDYSSKGRLKNLNILITTIIITTIFLLCHTAAIISDPFLYMNLSPSEPLGLYLRMPITGPLKNGDLVLLKVPEESEPYVYGRRWLPRGALLIKQVGGLPGDEYQIRDSVFWIRGELAGPVFFRDRRGLPLPQIQGTFRVRDGHLLPVSARIAHSYDGRYFGDVPISLVQGRAKPLLVFGTNKKKVP